MIELTVSEKDYLRLMRLVSNQQSPSFKLTLDFDLEFDVVLSELEALLVHPEGTKRRYVMRLQQVFRE